MKFLNNKTVLSVAIACALPASMVNAKTFDKTLADALAASPLETTTSYCYI